MVRSVERYPSETIVVVHAKLRKAPKRIKNATIHDYELEVYEVHKVINLQENTPFSVYDAENINRDKEDADEGDDASEESSPMTPRSQDSENVSVKSQDLLRRSTELSRLSGDISRSEPTHIFLIFYG
jgi:ergosteryl-3beta-O-L-aspartate synthase